MFKSLQDMPDKKHKIFQHWHTWTVNCRLEYRGPPEWTATFFNGGNFFRNPKRLFSTFFDLL